MERQISVTEDGLRLDRFLAKFFQDYSREYFKELVARGRVLVDGRARPADFHLSDGETVTVRWPEYGWAEQPFEKWILFEDASVLVLNKPAGLLVHPLGESWLKRPEAALSEPAPNLAGLLHRYRPAIGAAGAARCGLVHRLDRETSGVMVVAKTSAAQEYLVANFSERRIEKIYRAIVLGKMTQEFDVDAPIGRRPGRRRVEVTPYGKQSSTRFIVLKSGRAATLVEARPLTGRTHQIRAHLAHVRHPVFGDPEWASEVPELLKKANLPPPPRLMLHAYSLAFLHPKTGKMVHFYAPIPKDMRDYWRQVGK